MTHSDITQSGMVFSLTFSLLKSLAPVALIFFSTFVTVFCLGLQSQFVNHQKYWLAFLNSLAIGVSNLIILRNIPHAWGEIAAYLAGGATGIVCSMWAFTLLQLWRADRVNPQKLCSPKPFVPLAGLAQGAALAGMSEKSDTESPMHSRLP